MFTSGGNKSRHIKQSVFAAHISSIPSSPQPAKKMGDVIVNYNDITIHLLYFFPPKSAFNRLVSVCWDLKVS